MIDITEVLSLFIKLIFSAFGILVTWAVKNYLIPWIKSKLDANQMISIKDYAATLIKTAEQLEKNGYFSGFEYKEALQAAKKEYVLSAVKTRIEKWGFTFDEIEISDLIEGLIKETKSNYKEEG